MDPDKKYTGESHDLIVCACSDPNHQMVITQYDDHRLDENEMFVYIHLRPHTFIRRMIVGIRYLLGLKRGNGAFEEIMLTPTEVTKLQGILNKFMEKYK